MNNNNKIMTIFAHQDDETFSAGGVLASYKQSYAVSITKDTDRENEFQIACQILTTQPIALNFKEITPNNFIKIKSKLVEILGDIKPDIVVTHIDIDYHIEHRIVHDIVKEAVEWVSHTTNLQRNAHQVRSLWGAETTVLIPFPHLYIDITDNNQARMDAIAVYESQSHKGGQGFYSEFHGTRTKLRGIQAGTQHAEAFVNIPIALTGSFKPDKHYSSFP